MIAYLTKLEYWHWMSFGLILGIFDVLIGANFFFVWCGICAALVGLFMLLFPEMLWQIQFVVFGIGVFCSFFIWRHFSHMSKVSVSNTRLNQRAAQYIDRIFTLDEPIVNGRGRVRVDDSYWRVEGEDLPKGEKIIVTDVDGVVLKIKKV